jgi:hypothetical protein
METNLIKKSDFTPAKNGNTVIILNPVLSKSESLIVMARNDLRICDYENNASILAFISSMIQKERFVNGIKAVSDFSTQERQLVISAIIEVLKKFKWLTMSDLKIIFEKGMIGEFGDHYGINARTVNAWINIYNEKLRREALKKQIDYEQKLTSEAEKEKLIRESEEARVYNLNIFIKAFENIKPGATWEEIPAEIDPYNIWYNKFDYKGLIYFSVAEKQAIYDNELVKFLEEKQKIKEKANIIEAQKEARFRSKNTAFRIVISRMKNENVNIKVFLNKNGL